MTFTAWLAFSVERRFCLACPAYRPDPRVTDLWMCSARDHHAYQLLVEALREAPFGDRYFEIVEILPGLEDAYAGNNGRAPLGAAG